MTKNKNLLKKLKPKVNEAFTKLDKLFPDIEISVFDYSLLERAASLVEAVDYNLRFVYSAKYNFWFTFVFSLSKEFVVAEIKFITTEDKFKHHSVIVFKTDRPQLKPSKEHSLFVVLNGYNLPSKKRSKILEVLKKAGPSFNLKIGIKDSPVPFPGDLYYFEIPVEAKVLEYIV
jgi:hypothetical protein